MWWSHKHNGPGLRYEIGVCIKTGDICWLSGPYPPGRWPDVKIFYHGIARWLDKGERVEADDGYRGADPHQAKTPSNAGIRVLTEEQVYIANRVRARHETINKRFADWGCVKQRFHHDMSKHSMCMTAVVVLTQLAFNNGEPPFDVEYND